MWNDLEEDYRGCNDAACGTKENRVDLLKEWKKHQTFLEILAPIQKYIIWSGFRIALSAKDSVAFSLQGSAGWMSESIGRLIGVGGRHTATMRKALYSILSMKQV